MRILSIGTDRTLFEEGSRTRARHDAYAKEFGALDIVVFTSGNKKSVQAGVLSVTPTNSVSRFLYGFDALRIARKLPKPDVVTVQDPFETGLTGWLIARRLNVPLHVQVHTDFLSPEYARLSFLNRIRVLLAGFVLRRAAGIRVVSERIKTSIEKKYRIAVPVSVLPIFVDIAKFKNAQPITEFTDNRITNSAYKILVVSRDAPEKNIRLAVEAFKKAAPDNACLLLVGDIDVGNLSSREHIYGMGRSDPERYYKSVDLVLVPSKYEGYGLVIVEALAAGKPVLSTDVGIAREAGAIVTSPERFAGALSEWFKNGPREGHLVGYPYASVEEYVQKYCADISRCVTPVAVT